MVRALPLELMGAAAAGGGPWRSSDPAREDVRRPPPAAVVDVAEVVEVAGIVAIKGASPPPEVRSCDETVGRICIGRTSGWVCDDVTVEEGA